MKFTTFFEQESQPARLWEHMLKHSELRVIDGIVTLHDPLFQGVMPGYTWLITRSLDYNSKARLGQSIQSWAVPSSFAQQSSTTGHTPTVYPALSSAYGVSCCAQSLPSYRSLLPASSTFDLFFKVLFTFRSHYFFAIGIWAVFSFRRELPPTLVWSPNHTDS
jgi:hypothetical protein